MNSDFSNLLEVMAYLILGTAGITLFAGWAVKHFGKRK
jgi:hypothetical protein